MIDMATVEEPTTVIGLTERAAAKIRELQAEETFGFSILNPDSWRPSRKSICAPWRYGALNGSTTTLTPYASSSRSPSWTPRSKPSAYSNPEHPPP